MTISNPRIPKADERMFKGAFSMSRGYPTLHGLEIVVSKKISKTWSMYVIPLQIGKYAMRPETLKYFIETQVKS